MRKLYLNSGKKFLNIVLSLNYLQKDFQKEKITISIAVQIKIKEKASMMYKSFHNKLENADRRESQSQYGTTFQTLKLRPQ